MKNLLTKNLKKVLQILVAFLLFACTLGAADLSKVKGYWIIPDDDTGKPDSVAFFYEKDGKYYARMVLLYGENGEVIETIADPKTVAKGVKGTPKLLGLDFIFNLTPEEKGEKLKGKVLDPDNGMTFDCEVWVDEKNGNLIVRGELLVFGKNEYWKPIDVKSLPKSARINEKKIELNVVNGK